MQVANIFAGLPERLPEEQVLPLVQGAGLVVKRIVSQGHKSPAHGWYDQEQHEWVMVVCGAARLLFADGGEVSLASGDHLTIPAHCRHKVRWTDPDQHTVWLTVFYDVS